ncbi:hypothetical protein AX15_004654 [Amanita polypyramis BW_CC]|nr:hypothetical protein AX15_004654 [Amanita polypyramis BW_CC]
MSLPSLPDTLFSKVQIFDNHDAFPPNVTHPFSSGAEDTCALLQDLIHATHQVSTSINAHAPISPSNQKLVSALRQYSAIAHTLHASDQSIRHLVHSLKEQAGKDYGENIPLDPRVTADWCVSRLVVCGGAAGMEAFKDEGREGIVTVLLGGKVLVIDVDFTIDRSTEEPRIKNVSTKTSYATGSSSNANGSPYLDKLLSKSIQNFCSQVQNGHLDPVKAAAAVKLISQQLQYLVLLDSLAARKDSAGAKWFTDLDEQYSTLENLAREEAVVIASSLYETRAPLDIFLQRAHALPLPYLNYPSLSFLAYLSPKAYLSLLQQARPQAEGHAVPLNVSLSQLHRFLSSYSKGATMATLQLEPHSGSQMFPASMSMPSLTSRPTFPLFPRGSELEHTFLEVPVDVSTGTPPAGKHYNWLLDFTLGGCSQGVVLCQSRMREIEMILNPLGDIDNLPPVNTLSFQSTSWISLLLNPDSPIPSERYVATYKSPTNAHPPLGLRLISPNEPGFLLQKVPVHSMKEIWGILEAIIPLKFPAPFSLRHRSSVISVGSMKYSLDVSGVQIHSTKQSQPKATPQNRN